MAERIDPYNLQSLGAHSSGSGRVHARESVARHFTGTSYFREAFFSPRPSETKLPAALEIYTALRRPYRSGRLSPVRGNPAVLLGQGVQKTIKKQGDNYKAGHQRLRIRDSGLTGLSF